MTKEELLALVASRYSTEPEYPWDDESYIFRHRGNRKWFSVGMRIPYARLGLSREGETDVVNLKCGPLLMGAYRGLPGVFPGYHMNKDNWLTVLLDGTAEDEILRELLEISYDMTNSLPGRKRGSKTAKGPDGE